MQNLRTKKISVSLKVDADVIPFLFPLLGKGFKVCTVLGTSIKDFLCRQIGLSPDYLENRIQTIFLDGKAVDDVDSAVIKKDSVLALSGAMPGLAGATLRRGGFYGKMRGEISHGDETPNGICEEGHLTVKLFNLIVEYAGPKFLKKGVWVSGEDFYHLLTELPNRFPAGCRAAEFEGQSIDPAALTGIHWEDTELFLQVE